MLRIPLPQMQFLFGHGGDDLWLLQAMAGDICVCILHKKPSNMTNVHTINLNS